MIIFFLFCLFMCAKGWIIEKKGRALYRNGSEIPAGFLWGALIIP